MGLWGLIPRKFYILDPLRSIFQVKFSLAMKGHRLTMLKRSRRWLHSLKPFPDISPHKRAQAEEVGHDVIGYRIT